MIDKIISSIKGKELILLGEVHGTKEIPELITKLLVKYAEEHDFNLCLEIPESNQKFIDTFIVTGNEDDLKRMPFFQNSDVSDGRNSAEYFKLITVLRETNAKLDRHTSIYCIDVDELKSSNPQNERENALFLNILKHAKEKTTLAILGNVHASKNKLVFGELLIETAGYMLSKKLKDRMISINLAPEKGEFFNMTKKKIIYDKEFNKNFDFTFDIPQVSPCSFLEK